MPLHLLGKKSWNVYNKDNIERVRRDEAAATAREEAEEQRMQEIDAARRTAILRGEVPPPLPEEAADTSPKRERSGRYDGRGRDRKRRRLRGEDDTARDIRYAREDAEAGEQARTTLTTHSTSDAPLLDHTGHINLFPAPDEREIRKAERNAEADAEIAKKRKEYEDNYTVRFSDAAGYKRGCKILDVWGNEDPRRKEREQMRTSANDPIAFMQRAQAQLKQAEKDREKKGSEGRNGSIFIDVAVAA
ncbi:hypothetical protein H2203_007062 [Taxawa tesnikishii (nom. ined.)]|nr:hypothetical protein H2203_007062 [Dothideales sp. JES 119]